VEGKFLLVCLVIAGYYSSLAFPLSDAETQLLEVGEGPPALHHAEMALQKMRQAEQAELSEMHSIKSAIRSLHPRAPPKHLLKEQREVAHAAQEIRHEAALAIKNENVQIQNAKQATKALTHLIKHRTNKKNNLGEGEDTTLQHLRKVTHTLATHVEHAKTKQKLHHLASEAAKLKKQANRAQHAHGKRHGHHHLLGESAGRHFGKAHGHARGHLKQVANHEKHELQHMMKEELPVKKAQKHRMKVDGHLMKNLAFWAGENTASTPAVAAEAQSGDKPQY
jgi:hypothetical protein